MPNPTEGSSWDDVQRQLEQILDERANESAVDDEPHVVTYDDIRKATGHTGDATLSDWTNGAGEKFAKGE